MGNHDKHRPMVKEISALNTYWVVKYIELHHPKLNIRYFLENINNDSPYFVENITTGELEKITIDHLNNSRYWFSHEFVQAFFSQITKEIPDPLLGYKIAKNIYQTQPLLLTAIGISLLGSAKVIRKVSTETAKFNRTKTYTVLEQSKGYAVIRITHNPGIIINDFTLQWNAGCFASYGTLAGATDIDIKWSCIDEGPKTPSDKAQAIWDIIVHYKEPHILARLTKAIISRLPWIREIIQRAEKIELEHQEQILYRDRIIQKNTDKLLEIQNRLIEEERGIIEKKLHDISLELITAEERERKIIAEDIHDSVTQLLAISLSKIRSALNKNKKSHLFIDLENYLNQALSELRSLTFQISPPVLYDFGLEAAIEWLITDINDRQNMDLKYLNTLREPLYVNQKYSILLYRTIRELIINIIKHADTKEGSVSLAKKHNQYVIIVQDKGKGFSEKHVSNNGFGIHSIQQRINNLQGSLEISSSPSSGTKISISLPSTGLTQ